jgi:hypothetical protein
MGTALLDKRHGSGYTEGSSNLSVISGFGDVRSNRTPGEHPEISDNLNYAALDHIGKNAFGEYAAWKWKTISEAGRREEGCDGKERARAVYMYEELGLESLFPVPVPMDSNMAAIDSHNVSDTMNDVGGETMIRSCTDQNLTVTHNSRTHLEHSGACNKHTHESGDDATKQDPLDYYQKSKANLAKLKITRRPKPKRTPDKCTTTTMVNMEGPDMYTMMKMPNGDIRDLGMKQPYICQYGENKAYQDTLPHVQGLLLDYPYTRVNDTNVPNSTLFINVD